MNQKQIEKITQRFYKGQTTAFEEKMLLKEIRQNPAAEKYFRDFEHEFAESMSETPTNQKEWQKFQNKHLSPRKIRQRKIVRLATRYAAIFLAGILITTAFQVYQNYKQSVAPPSQWYETYVPRGEKSQLTLPDGTKVWLNAETSLRYPLSNKGRQRTLKLRGEAFFEVEEQKDKPFIVQTPDYDVVVKGTSFNIMAYEDFERTETSLIEGEVTIRNIRTKKDHRSVKLHPGQKLTFNQKKNALSIEETRVEEEMAWKNNLFMFSDTEFDELCRRLERWYDVDVTLADEELKEIRYTGKFRNEETIWQVLDIIKITTPIRYELKDRKVIIYKE